MLLSGDTWGVTITVYELGFLVGIGLPDRFRHQKGSYPMLKSLCHRSRIRLKEPKCSWLIPQGNVRGGAEELYGFWCGLTFPAL